ncbi:MAG: hypothetical protein ACI8ZM_005011, partial [Crocinitomix sp.]
VIILLTYNSNVSCNNMENSIDNETWIIDYGDEVIIKKSSIGVDKLSSKDRLVYCLWVADYSMRNAGDLESAYAMHPKCLEEGLGLAKVMDLKKSIELFQKDKVEFEKHFFNLFNNVCNELKNYT